MAHLPKRAFSSEHSGDMLLTPAVIDFLKLALSHSSVIFRVILSRPSALVYANIFARIYHRAFLTTCEKNAVERDGGIRQERKCRTLSRRTEKAEDAQRKLLSGNFGHSKPAKCCDTGQTVNTVGLLSRGALPMADLLTPFRKTLRRRFSKAANRFVSSQ
ncbi:hypothetical protein EAG_01073 [Camponotus floridanus]|uniref:Uncharacterized protein n=1 Tax=Camponotus floridanus TaxID=104421 RepID=E2AB57_CAMFO|nr:hypothetical protein EAG_01073 [Camponotus floridanus]